MATSFAVQAYFPLGAAPSAAGSSLQRKPAVNTRPGVQATKVNLKRRFGGSPLPMEVQTKMEQAFGADFSNVRVHIGPEAASIGAVAFTWDTDIHFAPGKYNPHTSQGRFLLGHELAHVVQQRSGRVSNPFGSGVAVVHDRALEAEADRFGRMAAALPVAQPITALQPKFAKPVVKVTPVPVKTLQARRNAVQPLFGYDIWGTATQVGGYVASGVGGALTYGRDTVTGTVGYVADTVGGVLNYGRRAVAGPVNTVADAVTGTARYVGDAVMGTARFVGGVPGAVRGAAARHALQNGRLVRIPARRGGLYGLAAHVGGGVYRGGAHLIRGVTGPLGFARQTLTDAVNFVGEGFTRPYAHAMRGVRGVRAHLGRGATGTAAYARQGYQALANNAGYFRGAALGFGAVGAIGAAATGVPLLYGAAAAGIPYAYDALNLAYMQGYELTHPGYHSVEYHSSWHVRPNLRARRTAVGGGLSNMRNILFQRNRHSNISSQFRTENWHRYSKAKAVEHLRSIDPAAVLLWRKPAPQAPGYRFTIQYPGWDTGITHNNASPDEGVRTEYVFSNFIRPQGAAHVHEYFLVQHFPQTGPAMIGAAPSPHNAVIHTSNPIG